MPYEPRKRQMPALKILIPALLAVFVLVCFGVSFFMPEEKKMYQIGHLSGEETKALLEKEADTMYTLSDYFFYGENLNVLKDPYNPEVLDDIAGKSIILKDVLSDKEYAFVVSSTIDSAITLNGIEEGFYEIYVVEDLIEKKAVMKKDVMDRIKTTLVKDTRHEVTFLASKEFFNKRDIYPKENYAYLQVEETSLKKQEYDIAIDPAAYDYDFTWTLNKGSEGHGLIECEESLKAADLLKEALEEKGYKVLVVRNKEEEINSYGEDGRLQRAYNANCKYYLRLCFSESPYEYGGFDIAYSAHSSNMFANQIVYHMKRNSDVSISTVYSIGQNKGVYPALLVKGTLDKKQIYDSDLWIREAGGKATLAGMYSENAQEGTAFFAKNNVFGMNALDINLGYMTNAEDVKFWKENKKEYMQDLADAISAYLNISE